MRDVVGTFLGQHIRIFTCIYIIFGDARVIFSRINSASISRVKNFKEELYFKIHYLVSVLFYGIRRSQTPDTSRELQLA